MNESILRWEKPTARGVRYYQVDLDRDLWGEWLIAQAWGRRGTRLGQIRVAPCGSRDEGLARIAAIFERRRQHRYRLVAGAGADSDTLWSLWHLLFGGKDRRRSRTAPILTTTPIRSGAG